MNINLDANEIRFIGQRRYRLKHRLLMWTPTIMIIIGIGFIPATSMGMMDIARVLSTIGLIGCGMYYVLSFWLVPRQGRKFLTRCVMVEDLRSELSKKDLYKVEPKK